MNRRALRRADRNFADMKRFLTLLTIAAVVAATDVRAQFTVEDKTKTKDEDVKFQDRLKNIAVSSAYYHEARARAERARIRKERNEMEIRLGLHGSLTSYNDAWTESRGGDNTISVYGTFNMKHVFRKDPFQVTTTVGAQLGYNRLRVDVEDGGRKGIWFKNSDYFSLSVLPEKKISRSWSYSANFMLRSQFLNGYKSRTEQTDDHVITSFMAPGYLDLSVGMTYTSPNNKFPIKISLNPLSSSGTLVFNDKVQRYYENNNASSYFGVDIDKHALFTGGSSINISFDRWWGKRSWFRYETNVYTYYGWITNVGRADKIKAYKNYLADYEKWEAGGQVGDAPAGVPRILKLDPTVEWKNTFTVKATKFLETKIYVQVNYDKSQNKSVQMYSMLTFGLTYTFKNKSSFNFLRW